MDLKEIEEAIRHAEGIVAGLSSDNSAWGEYQSLIRRLREQRAAFVEVVAEAAAEPTTKSETDVHTEPVGGA